MKEDKLQPTVTVTITKDDQHILGYVDAASVQDAMTHLRKKYPDWQVSDISISNQVVL